MVVFWPIIKNENVEYYKGIYNSQIKKVKKRYQENQRVISIIFSPGWRNLPITWLFSTRLHRLKISTRFVQSVMKFQFSLAWLNFYM